MAGNGKHKKLTPAQHRAVAALLTARDVADAAKQAKVGERTLRRWLAEDATFLAALEAAERAAIGAAVRSLAGAAQTAAALLRVEMLNSAGTPHTRIRAADVILGRLLQLRELGQLSERMAAIEAALSVRQNGE